MHTGAGFSVIQRKAVSVVIIGQRHLIRAFALCRCFGVSLGSIRTTVLRYALRHDHKTAVVAIAVLELLISKVFLKTLELADKVISKELEARPENTGIKQHEIQFFRETFLQHIGQIRNIYIVTTVITKGF